MRSTHSDEENARRVRTESGILRLLCAVKECFRPVYCLSHIHALLVRALNQSRLALIAALMSQTSLFQVVVWLTTPTFPHRPYLQNSLASKLPILPLTAFEISNSNFPLHLFRNSIKNIGASHDRYLAHPNGRVSRCRVASLACKAWL